MGDVGIEGSSDIVAPKSVDITKKNKKLLTDYLRGGKIVMQHCHADTGYGEKNHASLMSNSPYCLLYNSYDVTSESGKILSWSHMGV